MNRLARSLATLAVAAAIPLAASTLAAREGQAQQTTTTTTKVEVTTTEKTVEVQQADAKAEVGKAEVKDRAQVEKVEGKAITVEVVDKAQVGKAEGKTTTTTVEKKAEVPAKKEEAKVEKKVVVGKRAAVVAAPVQNLDPWIQQMTPQLRPMVRAQLHLIATACSPTPEQRKEFAAEGERVLKDVARRCAEMQMGQAGNRKMSDPGQMIAEALGVALKDRLTAEQRARYEAETKARAEARRRLVVNNLVASLDDELVLTPDQRAAIVAAMVKNYDESWCSTLQVLMYGTQFFPTVPDNLITPTLSPNQLNAWKKRNRNGSMAWWNFGHNGNAILLDDDIDPAPAPAPAAGDAAAVKKTQ